MSLSQSPSVNRQMSLLGPARQDITTELEVLERMLSFDGARALELGCGGAEKTRMIAERHAVAQFVAAEVDQIAHQKNLQITDLPGVTFKSYGAQQIAEADDQFDIVLMFKSLHHVPAQDLDRALSEIHRVLKPGGLIYCSEPVFAGSFNEIMRLFHDEKIVRQQAFAALCRANESSLFSLREEYFFKNVIRLKSWEQYEHGILNVTHTDHKLSDATLAEVKRRFDACAGEDGFVFEIPNRVDLLEKTG